MTDAPNRPALRDAGGAVVWLMALPLRWITEEPEKPWPAGPDDAESLYWVNYVRAWAWGMLTACWTVPWLVVVNLVAGPEVRHVFVAGVAAGMTCTILSGIRAGTAGRYGDRAALRRLLTPSSVDLVIAGAVAALAVVL